MGQWYEVGLQAGRKVTEAVDAFIKAEHKSDKLGDNFDPKARKTLSDGTTIYKWYMKWQPSWYEDEKRFMAVLNKYSDDYIATLDEDEDEDDYAWKLIAVGDEGGQDEQGNTVGSLRKRRGSSLRKMRELKEKTSSLRSSTTELMLPSLMLSAVIIPMM